MQLVRIDVSPLEQRGHMRASHGSMKQQGPNGEEETHHGEHGEDDHSLVARHYRDRVEPAFVHRGQRKHRQEDAEEGGIGPKSARERMTE